MYLLDNFDPIIGDDLGINGPRYSKVPAGFGFDSLKQRADCPLTNARWDDLIDFSNRYYAKFEIMGETWADFRDRLQLFYDKGADTFERLLEVYNDDIAKPILGRTEETTYDLTDTNTGTVKDTGTVGNNGTNKTKVIDVPADNPDDDTPTQRDETENNNTQTNDLTRTDDLTHKQTGSVKTELSDLGVRPNYESLNGFLDNNRTYYDVWVGLFKDCFAINDYLVW